MGDAFAVDVGYTAENLSDYGLNSPFIECFVSYKKREEVASCCKLRDDVSAEELALEKF